MIVVVLIITALHIRIGDRGTLYALIFKLPGINSMRVLNRFMHVELFLLLFILGFFMQRFKSSLMLIFFLLVFIDNSFDAQKIPRESKHELIKRKDKLISEIKLAKPTPEMYIALVDTNRPAYISHLDMMLATQVLQLKTLNGYSSYCPDAYGAYFLTCSETGLMKWIENQQIDRQKVLILHRTK